MAKFDDYENSYKHIRMERRDGILQIIFHTEGGPLKWSMAAHEELGYAFAEISRDEENKVVIITGTGDIYCSETRHGPEPRSDDDRQVGPHIQRRQAPLDEPARHRGAGYRGGQRSGADPRGNSSAFGHRDLLGKCGVPGRPAFPERRSSRRRRARRLAAGARRESRPLFPADGAEGLRT